MDYGQQERATLGTPMEKGFSSIMSKVWYDVGILVGAAINSVLMGQFMSSQLSNYNGNEFGANIGYGLVAAGGAGITESLLFPRPEDSFFSLSKSPFKFLLTAGFGNVAVNMIIRLLSGNNSYSASSMSLLTMIGYFLAYAVSRGMVIGW